MCSEASLRCGLLWAACIVVSGCNSGGGGDGANSGDKTQTQQATQNQQSSSTSNVQTTGSAIQSTGDVAQPSSGQPQNSGVGFLGKTWTAYTAIDPNNGSIFPVAGLASNGDVHGVWLVNYANRTGVEAGDITSGVGSAKWSLLGELPMGSSSVPYSNLSSRYSFAPIDIAVSPQGQAIAAWLAYDPNSKKNSVWYAVKNGSKIWAAPIQASAQDAADGPLKVVINDAGDAAIAYCSYVGTEEILVYSHSTASIVSRASISKSCGTYRSQGSLGSQKSYAFDLAMDSNSGVVHAVGLSDSTTAVGSTVITYKSYSPALGWSSALPISGDLPATQGLSTYNFSLSYSRSPNGNHAAIAWSQPAATYPMTDVVARFNHNGVWGDIARPETDNSLPFVWPQIAINDNGAAFIAMAGYNKSVDSYSVLLNRYTPSSGWGASLVNAYNGGYLAVDVAVDQFNNGLVTFGDEGFATFAGTLSKDGVWSKTKSVSPSTSVYGYQNYHYQHMKALPDGRALLVTAVRAEQGFVSSGYSVLQ